MRYRIVEALVFEILAERVTDAMNEGWQCLGAPFSGTMAGGHPGCMQAMVRLAPPAPEEPVRLKEPKRK